MQKKYDDNMFLIGQTAPPFQAKAIHGAINFPEDYKGKWVVFFTIPRDFHPNLLTESDSFIEMLNEFEKMNTQLVGLCVDSIYRYLYCSDILKQMKQDKIKDHIERIPIIEDAEKLIANKLCMLCHLNCQHCQLLKSVDSVIIIDPCCRIRCIQNYVESTWENLKEIKHIAAALQSADAD